MQLKVKREVTKIMKCIVLKEWAAGGQAKSFPMGVVVPPGTICEVNPYAAKNWLIPAGVLAPYTEEKSEKVK